MTQYVFDGNTKVWVVPTINVTTAPTQAEVRAGVDITKAITKDGLQQQATTNRVDAGDLSTTFDANLVGTQSTQLSLKMKRESPDNAGWTQLSGYGTNTFIVVGWRNFTGGTPTTGDKVDVYPVQTGQPEIAGSAANTQQTWTAQLGVTSQPAYNVAIA